MLLADHYLFFHMKNKLKQYLIQKGWHSLQHKSVSGHKKLIVGSRTVIGSFFINSNSRLLVSILIIAFLLLVSLQAINKNIEFGYVTIIETKNPITLNSIADPVHFSDSKNTSATTKGKPAKLAQNIS